MPSSTIAEFMASGTLSPFILSPPPSTILEGLPALNTTNVDSLPPQFTEEPTATSYDGWFDNVPTWKFLDTLPTISSSYIDPIPSSAAVVAYQMDGAALREVERDWDEMNYAYEEAWMTWLAFEKQKREGEKIAEKTALQQRSIHACLVFLPLLLTPEIRTASTPKAFIAPGEEAWDVPSAHPFLELTALNRYGCAPAANTYPESWEEVWGVDVRRVARMNKWEIESRSEFAELELGVAFAYWREKKKGLEWWDEDEKEEVRGCQDQIKW